MMLAPILAGLLGALGIIGLFLSALVGGTSAADWVLDASQASLIAGAIIFAGYIIVGLMIDIARAD